MATRRIIHDEFRKLMGQFGRLPLKEFIHKSYDGFFDWWLAFGSFFVAAPVIIATKKYFKSPNPAIYYNNYTIKRGIVPDPS